MKTEYIRKMIGWILLVSFVFVGFFSPVGSLLKTPGILYLFEGQEITLPKTATVDAKNNNDHVAIKYEEDAILLTGNQSGSSEIVLDFAGFPIKKVDVNILKDFKVIPGGQSIGVKIQSKGVLIVGHHQIQTEKGKLSPGEEAGIRTGDIITKINGEEILSVNDVGKYVQNAGEKGKPLQIEIKREKEQISANILPMKDQNDEKYKLGLYIRDSAAGIGTLTFYDPKTKKYGALGHVISDMDTKMPITVKDGYIVPSTVTSIQKGANGVPGEKLARFLSIKDIVGDIKKNNQFGIYGTLKGNLKNGVMDKPLPIALSHEVKKGPAQILTVVDENEVELFDVEVISSVPQKFPATKGMVIKITDPELLKKTGGIVQGMSGSPIIQNGKLIGAVTHVFVNDPSSGYGVHIEWMLNEAGLDIHKELEKAS